MVWDIMTESTCKWELRTDNIHTANRICVLNIPVSTRFWGFSSTLICWNLFSILWNFPSKFSFIYECWFHLIYSKICTTYVKLVIDCLILSFYPIIKYQFDKVNSYLLSYFICFWGLFDNHKHDIIITNLHR